MKKLILSIFAVFFLGTFAGNSQIFYKVEGGSAKAPSYIFGTHHLAPISIVEEAGLIPYLQQTEQVVGEIDLTGDPTALAMALQPFMMAPTDSTLTVLLKNEDINALNLQFEKWSPMPGMTLQMLDPLKPIAVTSMIASGMSKEAMPGFDPAQQLDTYLMKEGMKESKKIVGLETPEYQGEVLFNTTPLSVQAEALIDVLKNPEEAMSVTQKLTKAYQERNLNAMLELSKEGDENSEFMEYILYKRNGEWMNKLPEIIEDAPSFIVVGALHLAGPQGILEGLKSKGFVVTSIY